MSKYTSRIGLSRTFFSTTLLHHRLLTIIFHSGSSTKFSNAISSLRKCWHHFWHRFEGVLRRVVSVDLWPDRPHQTDLVHGVVVLRVVD
jgi:hypothetical protein